MYLYTKILDFFVCIDFTMGMLKPIPGTLYLRSAYLDKIPYSYIRTGKRRKKAKRPSCFDYAHVTQINTENSIHQFGTIVKLCYQNGTAVQTFFSVACQSNRW